MGSDRAAAMGPSPPSAPPPRGGGWIGGAVLWITVGIGICEMLAMTVELPWSWVPSWLASAVVFVGFLAFLVLAGFTSLLGNLVVGLLVFLALRRGRGWPLWGAALAAVPFGIAFYRLVPKPW